jgi:hypothetical protein
MTGWIPSWWMPSRFKWSIMVFTLIHRCRYGRGVHPIGRRQHHLHLPREKGYGLVPRTKNGRELAGCGSVAMTIARKDTEKTLPARIWRTLAWDRGKGLSDHARFSSESGVKVYFAAPRSPWQSGTNESTNGPLRQDFSNSLDLSRWTDHEIQSVAHAPHNRPRKALCYRTPAEAWTEYLKSDPHQVLRRAVESACAGCHNGGPQFFGMKSNRWKIKAVQGVAIR